MEIKIGVIGLGNAGGQVAAKAVSENIPAIAINVSADDTKSLEDKGVTTMLIGNNMGSGKNREVAKKYGKESIKEILDQTEFKSFMSGKQVVFVCYSTGGGTGAGIGPMFTAVLKAKYKESDASKRIRFINVGILPAISEALQAQEITMETIREITSYDNTYALYDNEHYSDLPLQEMMERVNTEIVEDFKVIRGDYNMLSNYTQIDPQDMMNIMSFDGMFRIASTVGFQEKDIEKETIEEKLIKSLSNTAGCEIERDRIVKCMATIVNIRPEVSDKFNIATPELRKYVGEPAADFSHYYVIDNSEGIDMSYLKNRVHVIMTGMSIPDDRLKKIVQRIEEAKAIMNQKKQSSVLAEYAGGGNVVGDATKASDDGSIDDVLGLF